MIDGNADVRNFTGKVDKNGMKGVATGFEKPALPWSAQRLP